MEKTATQVSSKLANTYYYILECEINTYAYKFGLFSTASNIEFISGILTYLSQLTLQSVFGLWPPEFLRESRKVRRIQVNHCNIHIPIATILYSSITCGSWWDLALNTRPLKIFFTCIIYIRLRSSEKYCLRVIPHFPDTQASPANTPIGYIQP